MKNEQLPIRREPIRVKRSTINAWVFYLGIPLTVGLINGANQSRAGVYLPWVSSLLFWIPIVLFSWWVFHVCTLVAARLLSPWSPPLPVKLAAGLAIATVPARYVIYAYIAAFDTVLQDGYSGPPPGAEFSFTMEFALYYFKSWIAIYVLWIGANLYFDRVVGFSRYRSAPRIPEDSSIVGEEQPTANDKDANTEPSGERPSTELGRNISVFLSRLPKSLGTNIKALQSEDHYLRVFTDMGDTLILFRLSDAIREMEVMGFEGMQVHRSYWVATDAVTGSKTEGRKTFLLLDCDFEIPVSQTYREVVRQAGLLG